MNKPKKSLPFGMHSALDYGSLSLIPTSLLRIYSTYRTVWLERILQIHDLKIFRLKFSGEKVILKAVLLLAIALKPSLQL